MEIPIILVHTGDSFYLEPVLRQARTFNPDSHIYLISDASTIHYDYVEHVDISEYSALADKFKEVYVHMSINPYHYELFCFQRWFVILDFVKKHNIVHFLCIDSDVMLYCNVEDTFQKWLGYDMVTCLTVGPQYTLFHKESLEKFCSYILSHYTEENQFSEVKEWHKHRGISDMTFFLYYSKLPSVSIFDSATIVDKSCFDCSLKIPQGFEMQGRLKKIYWIHGLPYCKLLKTNELVRLNAFHLQGGVKHRLNRYIYQDLPFSKRMWKNICWFFNPLRIKSRWGELRKILSNRRMFFYFIRSRVFWRTFKF